MNTPTEFLEGIHAALEKLPEDLAATLDYQKADLPDFTMPAGIDMGTADVEMSSAGNLAESLTDYPDFNQSSPGMPEFPSQATYSLSEADYPSFDSAGLSEGADAAFPDLAGFSMEASSMPGAQSAEYDTDQKMLDILEEISRNTAPSRGGGSTGEGFVRSTGPQQIGTSSAWARN